MIYALDDGTTVAKGGTFDLDHVYEVQERVERRTGQRVIATRATWKSKRPRRVEHDVAPAASVTLG